LWEAVRLAANPPVPLSGVCLNAASFCRAESACRCFAALIFKMAVSIDFEVFSSYSSYWLF